MNSLPRVRFTQNRSATAHRCQCQPRSVARPSLCLCVIRFILSFPAADMSHKPNCRGQKGAICHRGGMSGRMCPSPCSLSLSPRLNPLSPPGSAREREGEKAKETPQDHDQDQYLGPSHSPPRAPSPPLTQITFDSNSLPPRPTQMPPLLHDLICSSHTRCTNPHPPRSLLLPETSIYCTHILSRLRMIMTSLCAQRAQTQGPLAVQPSARCCYPCPVSVSKTKTETSIQDKGISLSVSHKGYLSSGSGQVHAQSAAYLHRGDEASRGSSCVLTAQGDTAREPMSFWDNWHLTPPLPYPLVILFHLPVNQAVIVF